MNSRERIIKIISGEAADRCGFWLGDPDPRTWPILHKYFGTKEEEELRQKLGDDFRFIRADLYYNHIREKELFEIEGKLAHGTIGPFANITDFKEIDNFNWPKHEYLDFSEALQELNNTGPYYRASGMWTKFYHVVMDLFGMENYLMKMFMEPEIVHAVTDRVCTFYYEANERFYKLAGDKMDGYFFGNDFGTQADLICTPDQFREFIKPWFSKFTEQAKQHGYQVILHSCGSIHRVIEDLIEMKVDCLNPIQAKAKNMDAETLARDFKGRISFLGGIDTQELMNNGTPQQVKEEVRRVKRILGPHFIVAPSHETILPDVPPQNVAAMAEAALES